MDENMEKAYRVGIIVLIFLAVLTAVEYLVGSLAPLLWAVLVGIALIKAFFVARDYMHIGRVFDSEEEEVHS